MSKSKLLVHIYYHHPLTHPPTHPKQVNLPKCPQLFLGFRWAHEKAGSGSALGLFVSTAQKPLREVLLV